MSLQFKCAYSQQLLKITSVFPIGEYVMILESMGCTFPLSVTVVCHLVEQQRA